jgi:replicative DNA helicase
LIVDLENRESQIRRRLHPLVAQAVYTTGSEDWTTERCFVYPRPEGIDVRSRNDLGELIATVRQVRPQLVTIGPLYKMALGDPTDEEVAKAIAGVLDRLTVRFGCALMIEAHAPHGDSRGGRREMRVYGASLWQRWPEFGIGLYPESDGGMIVEHWRGAREEREWPSHLARGRAWPWVVQTDDTRLDDDDQGQEF